MVTGKGRRHSQKAGSPRRSGSPGRAMRWKLGALRAAISHRGEIVARDLTRSMRQGYRVCWLEHLTVLRASAKRRLDGRETTWDETGSHGTTGRQTGRRGNPWDSATRRVKGDRWGDFGRVHEIVIY